MKKIILFILIFTLAFITRFYLLGQAPKGLYLDEAGQGYSAYSLLKTGKDEFGKISPIVFRSFTDFKTPVYIYLIVPLIPLFDLTPFTVRFPSFFFSLLTFPILYLLINKLLENSKINDVLKIENFKLKISSIIILLLSISPWHILFGRTNFECNVALFFFLAGIYFFYLSLKKPSLLILSALFFAIAIPAYHSQRIDTPLIILLLVWHFRKNIFTASHRPFILISLFLGFLISLPTLSVAFTPGFLARASGLNIFSHVHQMPSGFLSSYNGSFSWLVNSSWFLSTQEFLSLYFSYFSPRNMFVLGDSGLRSSFPELSTFFLWQFPFYIIGLFELFKNKKLGELRFLTLALLFITPLPAAVTRDPYSTIRSLPLVIPQLIIISLGLLKVYSWLKTKLLKKISVLIFIILIFYSLAKLYSSVIILNEHFRAQEWNYGWQEVAATIKTFDPNLPVVIDNARNEPYIQLLFFLKFDPSVYQKENHLVDLDQYYTDMQHDKDVKINNIYTRAINWKPDLERQQYLIGDALAISYNQIARHHLQLIKEIKYPDNSVAFRIVKTNP